MTGSDSSIHTIDFSPNSATTLVLNNLCGNVSSFVYLYVKYSFGDRQSDIKELIPPIGAPSTQNPPKLQAISETSIMVSMSSYGKYYV